MKEEENSKCALFFSQLASRSPFTHRFTHTRVRSRFCRRGQALQGKGKANAGKKEEKKKKEETAARLMAKTNKQTDADTNACGILSIETASQ